MSHVVLRFSVSLFFTALNLLYVKDLIVNGLYSSYTRKSSTETEGVVNKETYGYKQSCLFSRVFDLQNSICYRRLQLESELSFDSKDS